MVSIDDLGNLTEAERKQLYSTLAFEFASTGKPDAFSPDEQITWHAICDSLGAHRALGPLLDRLNKKKDQTRAEFSESIALLMDWIDRGCGQPVTKTQRMAIVSSGVECLNRYLRRNGALVTHSTMLMNLEKIPGLIDRAYPMYQSSKILHRIAPMATA